MTVWANDRRELGFAIVGAVAAVIALLLALFGAREALTGWLTAAATIEGLPAGAIILLLTMRLISGKWTVDLRPPARMLGTLWPLAALAFVPVMIGMASIYPWYGAPAYSGFDRVWMYPAFFVGRSVCWFVLGWFIAGRADAEISQGSAAGMLIVFVILANFVNSDWMMTLLPKFASSAFGSQIMALDACTAIAVMILFRLATAVPRFIGVMGGIMLTLLLIWAYFQFMPVLIMWSGNLAETVGWLTVRENGGWEALIAVAATLGGVPLLALFAPQVRNNPRLVGACAASVVLGKTLEFAWMTLPGRGWLAIVAWLVALLGLGCLAVAVLMRAVRVAEVVL